MASKVRYSKEFLLGLYQKMIRVRYFEEKAAECFTKGMLAGNIHLCIGQESSVIGSCAALEERDFITSTHRGHGHCIGKGAKTDKAMAELFGKKTGYCKGKGGSMHIVDADKGILGANGIVGAGIPIAAGSALASKIMGTDEVTMCFFGDAAANQGTFHEAINMAAAWKLPVVFLCENNGYGVSVAIQGVTNTETIAVRAKAYDIPGVTVDGSDVLNVYETVKKAVEHVRSGKGPSLVEVMVYRWQGHYCGDPASYRPKEYVENAHLKDPIKLFKDKLISTKQASKAELEKLEQEIFAEIEQAENFAVNSDYPDISEAFTDVYSSDNERSVAR
ncbi:thiamine pyrophosphate-dependent dehydrogenase E1 component subunit alpha [Zophobihabitans entericus]|uniref:Thiamine pyrophosphate-dependent dehydrogenase E1 component subunit alpha n=1 Tax=Zophobihabitans entericus TaxID=1635327 RepID=A0A6G9I8M8_9GAMM|nr:thiamine pyrophosphate-dependent dehydrogenase E1 component subunit alpha [Zophobihabitans entericus]QIQ20571.1 thiamine pyrophosphate-dependent dehydrogenase E1 component subunit alpha [Zophobihabitans entericus]